MSPVKDRYREEPLAPDVRILITQSSAYPVEYAIVLVARRVNDAMHAALVALRSTWCDIVEDWEMSG